MSRSADRSAASARTRLLVALDLRVGLSQQLPQTEVGVRLGIGEVMHDHAWRPLPVRRSVKLGLRDARERPLDGRHAALVLLDERTATIAVHRLDASKRSRNLPGRREAAHRVPELAELPMEIVDVALRRSLCRLPELEIDGSARAELGPLHVPVGVPDTLSSQLGDEIEVGDAQAPERLLPRTTVLDESDRIFAGGSEAADHHQRPGGLGSFEVLPAPLPASDDLVRDDQGHRTDGAAEERVVGSDDGVLTTFDSRSTTTKSEAVSWAASRLARRINR